MCIYIHISYIYIYIYIYIYNHKENVPAHLASVRLEHSMCHGSFMTSIIYICVCVCTGGKSNNCKLKWEKHRTAKSIPNKSTIQDEM